MVSDWLEGRIALLSPSPRCLCVLSCLGGKYLGQAGVVLLLLPNAGRHPPLVVVGGVHL